MEALGSRGHGGCGLRGPGVARVQQDRRYGQVNGEQWALGTWPQALPVAFAAPSTAECRELPARCPELGKFPPP